MILDFNPANFWYFLVLWSISIGFGIYLFISYRKSLINYLNSLLFFFTAITASLEYYIQQFEIQNSTFEACDGLIGPITHAFFLITWFLIYIYINPFRNSNYEKTINAIVVIFIIFIPGIITMYLLSGDQIFTTNSHKSNGLWTYKATNSSFFDIYVIYTFGFMAFFFSSALYLYSLKVFPHGRLKKIFFLVFYLAILFFLKIGNDTFLDSEWEVSAFAINLLLLALIMTWFFSDYRGLQNGYKLATSDLLDSISDLCIQTDLHFNITNFNKKTATLFGKPHKSISKFLSHKSGIALGKMESLIDHLIENQTKSQEIQLTAVSGKKYIMQIKASDFNWRGGIGGYTFFLTDLTDLKEKERLLKVSNETKDQLFSLIAHDLRKPAIAFKGIVGKVNYLVKKKKFDLLDKLCDSIEKSSIQLNSMLDNLLNWALINKNEIKVSPVRFDVITKIFEITEDLEILAKQKDLKLDIECEKEDNFLFNDPDFFNIIIRNILDNSIKYSFEHSSISIKVNPKPQETIIMIRDSGIGMSPDQIKNIATINKKEITKGTSGEKGNGLGLCLVHELIEKTQGSIKYSSKVGEGTVIELGLKNYHIASDTIFNLNRPTKN